MPAIIDKVLRAGEGKILRKLQRIVQQVNSVEEDYEALSDEELRALTREFKERYAGGDSLDDLLPEAFAAAREAAKRTLGQRAFDVQLMGGGALHFGNIAEMKTGEGKTLTGVFAAYLNALAGQGVHIVTVNDYLAKRDAEWMGRVHRFLGLDVGVILAEMEPDERRKQYAADITYGTNNEFGFDYLRDNMTWAQDECVQRGHHFAIVDEVDSILIDEARTPLIISGPADQNSVWYSEFAKIVPRLRRGEDGEGDYEVDEKKRTVGILESGVAKVEDWLGIDNLYDHSNTHLVGFLNNAIKAKELFRKDKDYVVSGGEVLIVDDFTGRILHGRRYSDGMHQAIEAKEGVKIMDENQTLATITLQNYFRLYDKLAGMTGTAITEANEFHQTYKLGVVPIPTNKPMIRADQPDVVYQTEQAKFDALVQDITERHEIGQPVLVGTVSVEKSEVVSRMLKRKGVPHQVLNAKYHEQEATIVAQAGRKGAVTVATNMAGRGTDIMLGGNPEFIADLELHHRGLSPVDTPEDYEAAWPEAVDKAKRAVAEEHEEVVGLGGLYVLGTERHESRRIDNQLRGRSGRQGDPGESRFYLSFEDDLMRRFNGDRVAQFLEWAKTSPDVPIESKTVTRSIRSAQTQVEQLNFEIRKDLLKYDDVMNRQRTVVYAERHRVLAGEDLTEQVRGMISEVLADYVATATSDGFAEEWDLEELWRAFGRLYPVGLSIDQLVAEEGGERSSLTADIITARIQDDAQAAYDKREEELTPEIMRELERRVVLSVLDSKWREHLYEMDYLREGISLRAMAQRDPLVEYQREGYELFNAMMDAIKEESVGNLFHLQVEVEQSPIVGEAGPDGEWTGGAGQAILTATPPPAAQGPSPAAGTAAPAPATAGRAPSGRKAAGKGGAGKSGARNAGGGKAPAGQVAGQANGDVADAVPAAFMPKDLAAPKRPGRLSYSAPSEDGSGQAVRSAGAATAADFSKVGRNEPCPCGSGRKFKLCHGDPRRRD
ncbi:MAG TPA: preprotein translocase subunit SecA [Streptosporangiaceae bacterium]|nr:preprotein translocase subunit SecA [Streptosporangiaceae bacterium]